MTGERVLVTGAGGFIGRHLVPRLLEEGLQVSILSRDPGRTANLPWYDQVRVFEGDLCEPAQLRAPCQGQQYIIHCAGLAHAGADPASHRRVNLEGSRNLLAAARAEGCANFLYLSSSKAAAGERAGPYGHAKHQVERLLQDTHRLLQDTHHEGSLRTCSLRPAAVYGPGMKGNLAGWIRAIERGRAPPLPPVDTRLPMIAVQDLCEAIVLAIRTDAVWGRIHTLTDGRAYNVKDIENRIRACLGRTPARWHLPRTLFWLAALTGEGLSKSAGIHTGLGLSGYNTLFRDDYRTDGEFARLTGFRARRDFYSELPALIPGIIKQ